MWVKDVKGTIINLKYIKHIYIDSYEKKDVCFYYVRAGGEGDSRFAPEYTLARPGNKKIAKEFIDNLYKELKNANNGQSE